jgi:hypothetical protein
MYCKCGGRMFSKEPNLDCPECIERYLQNRKFLNKKAAKKFIPPKAPKEKPRGVLGFLRGIFS